jgi:hypothetical protein
MAWLEGGRFSTDLGDHRPDDLGEINQQAPKDSRKCADQNCGPEDVLPGIVDVFRQCRDAIKAKIRQGTE